MITTKDLIKDNHPMMREKSLPVPLPLSNEHRQILEAMMEHIVASQDEDLAEQYELRGGVGLAAVQAGHLLQMLVVHVHDEDGVLHHYALVNPRIVSHSTMLAALGGGEACLSVEAEHEGLVHRHHKITIKAYNLYDDAEITIKARGYLAIVLQHEMDHLKGIMFYDHIIENDLFGIKENEVILD